MSVAKWMPVMYATYYGDMSEIANRHGYALAIHGSLLRDMDLVLTPWIDEPDPFFDVLLEWRKSGMGFQSWMGQPFDSYELKPNGRIAFVLHTASGGYIDVSITPVFKYKEDTNG